MQHALCITIGLFSLVQGLMIKAFLPVEWFESLSMKEGPMSDEQACKSFASTLRKSHRESLKLKDNVKIN